MKKIEGFCIDRRKHNETHYGTLYYRYIKIPFANKKYQTRVMRLWVPPHFDINKEYGVIYMTDGQNAVDENLTAYGEWNMEDHLHDLVEEGYPEFIIVGIDCPHNGDERTLEYLVGPQTSFKTKKLQNYYGDKMAAYFADKVVPYINSKFNINQDLVTFCGSSMGGLFSFYICSKYPKIFKNCISFSPAFFFFSREQILNEINKLNPTVDSMPKYVYFMGGGDRLEKRLAPYCDYLVNEFRKRGFNEDRLLYMKDESRIHHESTWSDFVKPAIRFLLDKHSN